jgi:predicted MPP superfamily phosphohydrolase
VTGNHEYYAGAEQWLRHLPTLGVRPLQNERVRLQAFELAGVPDWTAEDFPGTEPANLDKALDGRDPSLPLVLLAHQPRHAYEAMASGVDLQLAGHTHGGQMFPMTWLIHLAYPFIAGLYPRGSFQIYVSEGTGYWGPPMRLGTKAEITHITLRRSAVAEALPPAHGKVV